MKTTFQLLLVTLIFGGAATAATLFWQKQQSELRTAIQRAEAAESKAAENPLADLEKPSRQPAEHDEAVEEQPEPPVAVRPPYVDGMDEASQLVVSLNQRLRATHEKERRLDERQEALKLIFSDIRDEQAEISQLREEAMKATQGERELLSQELDSLRKSTQGERELLRQELDSLRSPPPKADTAAPAGEPTSTSPSAKTDSDPTALKRLGGIYDSMPAEVVAEVLQQLVKQKRDTVVVEILQSMKDRQAAKVLATIAATDAAKAASLTELLKRP